jgi:hypothetical protein
MKHLVRAIVVTLTIAGAAASASSSSVSAKPGVAKTSAFPIPTCPPDGTTSCN